MVQQCQHMGLVGWQQQQQRGSEMQGRTAGLLQVCRHCVKYCLQLSQETPSKVLTLAASGLLNKARFFQGIMSADCEYSGSMSTERSQPALQLSMHASLVPSVMNTCYRLWPLLTSKFSQCLWFAGTSGRQHSHHAGSSSGSRACALVGELSNWGTEVAVSANSLRADSSMASSEHA